MHRCCGTGHCNPCVHRCYGVGLLVVYFQLWGGLQSVHMRVTMPSTTTSVHKWGNEVSELTNE